MWWFSPVPAVFKLDSLAAQACGTAPRASRALRVADTTALRAALDPRASAVPSDRLAGRPVACPGAVRRKGIGASRPIYPPTDVSVGPKKSTGQGTWSATGEGTFRYTVREQFNLDVGQQSPNGKAAAYLQIDIEARRSGDTFAGTGTAEVHGPDGSVIYSTTAETTARQLTEN